MSVITAIGASRAAFRPNRAAFDFYQIFKPATPQASNMGGLPSGQRLLKDDCVQPSTQKKEMNHGSIDKTGS
jgi:hypothetical protein